MYLTVGLGGHFTKEKKKKIERKKIVDINEPVCQKFNPNVHTQTHR